MIRRSDLAGGRRAPRSGSGESRVRTQSISPPREVPPREVPPPRLRRWRSGSLERSQRAPASSSREQQKRHMGPGVVSQSRSPAPQRSRSTSRRDGSVGSSLGGNGRVVAQNRNATKSGTCAFCGDEVEVGDALYFNRFVHYECGVKERKMKREVKDRHQESLETYKSRRSASAPEFHNMLGQ